jgi:hypothetical protein
MPTTRQRLLERKTKLWTERSSWEVRWRDIAKYMRPDSLRLQTTDVNDGKRKDQAILDSSARRALRTLAAGMMSGMTSPARPWFRLSLPDKDLVEFGPVKQWLHDTAVQMQRVFSVSNTYTTLHRGYADLGAFGVTATFVAPDFDNIIHHHPMLVGEYALATDDKGRVQTLVRQMKMTTGQMAKRFERGRLSSAVRNLLDRNQFDEWVDVIHFIEPRDERDVTKRDRMNMPFASCYFEPAGEGDTLLSEAGFERFPVLAPRWEIEGNDVWGHSPAMECVGDVKQLQFNQTRKSQAVDYQVNPPLQVPTGYQEKGSSRLPGGIMYVPSTGGANPIRSAWEVNLDLGGLREDIEDVRQRIRSTFYEDLFQMLIDDRRSGVTATEIAERHEEKMLMLGPVLERLHNELLSPLIDMAYERLAQANALPPPPEELQGMDLEVEFVSVLAQAQRVVAAAGTDRLLGTVGTLAQMNPAVIDKIDMDQVVDGYAEMFGVDPKIIVPDDKVAELRAQRAQQQQAQQAAEAAPAMAQTAKAVSGIDTRNMSDVLNMFQGYGSPSSTEVGA